MNRDWTAEDRKRQAEAIRAWRPWEHSTGPKTAEGKEASKMNARKHDLRSAAWQALKRALWEQRRWVEDLE